MKKHKTLFVCVHNSARSQMAQAFLNVLGKEAFTAESAGLEPGTLNPFVVEAMAEVGIDISRNPTKAVFDLFREDRKFDAVITVCDAANAERCPVFPGKTRRIAWSFPDPSAFKGTKVEIMKQVRQVRNEIKLKVQQLIAEASNIGFWM
jgi:arsenate reductase